MWANPPERIKTAGGIGCGNNIIHQDTPSARASPVDLPSQWELNDVYGSEKQESP